MDETLLEGCVSYSDVCRRLNLPINGSGIRRAKEFLKSINFDTSIFSEKKWVKSKYKTITKQCPVCSSFFTAQENSPKEKATCSYACSNSFFRSGKENGQFNQGVHTINKETGRKFGTEYRYICFSYWEHKCSIPDCNWDKVVEVHHIDGDRHNNKKENLIPLCPNHHRLTITNQYKDEIDIIIKEVIENKFSISPNILPNNT